MKAKNFKLKDKDGKEHTLNKIEANFTVVYFYPKDNTPGCTVEAIEFSKDLKKFEKLGATIIGISGGDEKTKTKFCEKHDLKVILLSDPDFEISKKYGAYGLKKFMGREYDGIYRYTFLLDKNKNIIKKYEDVKPAQHSKEVLNDIKNFEKEN